MLLVMRGGAVLRVSLSDVKETDLVMRRDGRFVSASNIPALKAYMLQAHVMQQRTAAGERNGWGAILILALIGFGLCLESYDPPPAPRRKRRNRNDEPLTARHRARVRERDGETCVYCGSHDARGHVDHRVSRANGGTNHMNNLSWACAPCNLQKGAMNARQFIRRNAGW